MSVFHIEIYQIDETKTVEIFVHICQCFIDAIFVILCPGHFCDTFSRKNIIDLANSQYILAGIFDIVQHGIPRWCQRKVVTSACAGKMTRYSNKRTGNDPAYGIWSLTKPAGSLTDFIKFLHGNNIFMGGNLQYAVSRGIYDDISCFHMFFAVFFDNFRAGIWHITKNLSTGFRFQGMDQILRKSIWKCRHCLW